MRGSDIAASRGEWGQAQLRRCRLCPRACGVDRTAGQTGWCGAGADVRYFMEFVNFSEEPELSPSHALCLTGCNLDCLFCHTGEARRGPARELTAAGLAELVARGRREGARNLNVYGGEPIVNLPGLLRLFADVADLPPLVWNTNLYATAETLAHLAGLADLYLVDLKFGPGGCAGRLARTADYWAVLTARLRELAALEPGRVLVRHLVMPGHLACCTRPVLEWLRSELPGVRVSLRTGYLVMPAARADQGLGRFLSADEVRQASAWAAELGLPLVETEPCRCEARTAGRGRGRRRRGGAAAPAKLDVEIVLSTDGRVFVRNAPREVAALVQEITTTGVRPAARRRRAGEAGSEEVS